MYTGYCMKIKKKNKTNRNSATSEAQQKVQNMANAGTESQRNSLWQQNPMIKP